MVHRHRLRRREFLHAPRLLPWRQRPLQGAEDHAQGGIDEDAWATSHSDAARPFPRPKSGRISVKVINHLGDEVIEVFRVG